MTCYIYAEHDCAFYWITQIFKFLIQFVLSSLSTDRNAELFLFHCKEKTNSKGQCRMTQFKRKLDKIQLIRFLQSQTLPKYVSNNQQIGGGGEGQRREKKLFANSLVWQANLMIYLSVKSNIILTKKRRMDLRCMLTLGSADLMG